MNACMFFYGGFLWSHYKVFSATTLLGIKLEGSSNWFIDILTKREGIGLFMSIGEDT